MLGEERVDAATVATLTGMAQRWSVPPAAFMVAAHAKVLAALTGSNGVTVRVVRPGESREHRCDMVVGDVTWRELVLRGAEALIGDGPVVPAAPGSYRLDLSGLAGASGDVPLSPGAVAVRRAGDDLLLLARGTSSDGGGESLRLAGYHATALRAAAAEPEAPHRARTLLSAGERALQLDLLAGPVRPVPDRRAHELFEECVRRVPDGVAAVQGATRWTYALLNRRANRVAHTLLRSGVGAEDVVAVVAERGLDWLAAVLGVLKAGAAYLPVEPDFPAERIAAMLAGSGCRTVVAQPDRCTALEEAMRAAGTSRRIDLRGVTGVPDSDPGVEVTAGQLAYVFFTSGSSGTPKGAMCEHAGLTNHLFAKIDDLHIGPGTTVAQTAPQCFDISLWQLLAPLLVGGRTYIVDQADVLDIERYLDAVTAGEVEVLQAVPSYLDAIVAHLERHPRRLDRLRVVSATGEELKKPLVARWFQVLPDVALLNAYGLTETSDDTNHHLLRQVPAGDRVPVGRAVNNVGVYVVDEHLQLVPYGAPGEIVFSGICVGRGYINDQERTALAFTEDPFRPGRRLYRSGDFGRWLPGGELEFLGRRDSQVKVNGFRVELGEIEMRMSRLPGVRDAAVAAIPAGGSGMRLAGFYTADRPVAPEEVRTALAAVLPGYLVPRTLHQRPELPLNGNGKVDRGALCRLAERFAETSGEVPRTPTERRLAQAWAEVLARATETVHRDDHFFDIGGTSLAAVRLGAALGGRVSLENLVRHPVLADLARLIDAQQEGERP
ncbi:non-ribosomal peptide synthetase [Actinoplanes sp. NPDC049548]|uniref:non-ribosomal peptide synthetase n=1 Tax=Actinoplanes sp. NPDC049548 TaxID=3155152 RepID=UPI003426AAC2